MFYPDLSPTRPTAHVAEPTLVLCSTPGSRGPPFRRTLPREGLLLGAQAGFGPELTDPRLATRHALMLPSRRGRWLVRDLESAAGTRVNGEQVTGERELEAGDVIRLGDTLFLYCNADDQPGSALGESDAMRAVDHSIDVVAPRRHTVVVTGETGTGKEVVARQIHERSGRTGPFVAVNCSTFGESLLSSELFGHVKGAFTGAVGDTLGLFRAAEGGTLLLDEIADIPVSLQASLLRVLETQQVRPVGGTRDIAIDVRVVATINREVVELVQEGKFRPDLYARLAQWTIRLPRLRDRRDDIPGLIHRLLPRVEGRGRALSADLAERLLTHDWPLNVRGLLNALSIAVVSTDDPAAPLALTPEVESSLWTSRSMTVGGGDRSIEIPRATLAKGELEALMVRFHGHVTAAGRHVGMPRGKLYRLLEMHGLDAGGFRSARSTLYRPAEIRPAA